MPQKLIAGLPPDLDITGGYIIRFTAIDPTTGADVAGVVISNASIRGLDLTGQEGAGLATGEWKIVPGPE